MAKMCFILIAFLFVERIAHAQSVEVYAGHKRAGVDLMWFKNFKNKQDAASPFLFFSRNRASVAYNTPPTAFGSTNAVSYNFKNGLGLVAVGSFLNAGFTPKAGVQYYKRGKDWLFFGWLVADLKKEGNFDLFGLFRYQPSLGGEWKLFGQAELFPVYNPSSEVWSLTQRFRLGIRHKPWAAGLMLDFNQTGRQTWATAKNIGTFLRHEF